MQSLSSTETREEKFQKPSAWGLPSLLETGNVECIQLRPSSLMLSRFDERMPSRSPQSKSAIFSNKSSKSFHTRQSSRASYFDQSSSTRVDDRTTTSSVPSKRLSLIHPISEISFAEEHDAVASDLKSHSSILQEIVTKQRHLMYIIIIICGLTFFTGLVITAICFTSPISDQLIPGKIIGLIMFAGGGITVILFTFKLSIRNQETKEKIKRREKLFGMFQDVEKETEIRENEIFLKEKVVPKINGKGDNNHLKETE
ncbi:uncharacterized protein LOC143453001 [Clavelina lepadiformis]|uniref:uncharacterized protein LOC143453001 n=1 Tax=Clavelina lepadiformis TaxID=159417 RepID=UPI0040436B2E